MDSICLFFFLGIGLSMDTFTLSILYGTNGINKKQIFILSSLVGLFHFMMPFIGYNIIGLVPNSFLHKLNVNLITGIILIILSIDMIIDTKEKKFIERELLKLEMLLFAFTVSIDSFSIGIALGLQKSNIILAGIVFALCSFVFTFMGLKLGKIIKEKFNSKINLIGAIILLVISIKYLIEGIN